MYFNLSSGNEYRGPWNQGESTQLNETWQYIEDPIKHVLQTNSLLDQSPSGVSSTLEENNKLEVELGTLRSEVVNTAAPIGPQQWNKPLANDELGVSLEKANLDS